MNKKAQFDDMVDIVVAFALLIIIILISGAVLVSIKYQNDVRYQWEMKKYAMEENTIIFLRGTALNGQTMYELIQHQDPSSQSLLRREINSHFTSYFGSDPWRFVIQYPDGEELAVDESAGPSRTVAELILPSSQGNINIYLQTGDLSDELKSNFWAATIQFISTGFIP